MLCQIITYIARGVKNGEKILKQPPIRDGSEKEFHLEMKHKKLEKPVPVVPNSYTPNLPYES